MDHIMDSWKQQPVVLTFAAVSALAAVGSLIVSVIQLLTG